MKNVFKLKVPLVILCIIIAVTMGIQLFFSICEGSKEKIIGSSIVLLLSLIAIILFIIFNCN